METWWQSRSGWCKEFLISFLLWMFIYSRYYSAARSEYLDVFLCVLTWESAKTCRCIKVESRTGLSWIRDVEARSGSESKEMDLKSCRWSILKIRWPKMKEVECVNFITRSCSSVVQERRQTRFGSSVLLWNYSFLDFRYSVGSTIWNNHRSLITITYLFLCLSFKYRALSPSLTAPSFS